MKLDQKIFSEMTDKWSTKHGFLREYEVEKVLSPGIMLRLGDRVLKVGDQRRDVEYPGKVLGELHFVTEWGLSVRNVSGGEPFFSQDEDSFDVKFRGTITDIFYASAETSEKDLGDKAILTSWMAFDVGDSSEILLIADSIDDNTVFLGGCLEGMARGHFFRRY